MAHTLTSASDFIEAAWLNHALRNVTSTPSSNVYVVPFTVAPSDSGGGTVAATPQVVTFSPAAHALITLDGVGADVPVQMAASEADVTFAGVPAGDVTHVAVVTDPTYPAAGNVLFWGAVDDAVDPAGDDLIIAAGTLRVAVREVYMTPYLGAAFLNHYLRSESYSPAAVLELALLDDQGVEVSGGSYAREPVTFGAPAPGTGTVMQVANDVALDFTGLPAFTWGAGRLHESPADGGQALWEWPITPKGITAGSSLTFAVGSTVAGLD